MRGLYSTLLYLLTPFVLLRLIYRGLRAPDYWRRWPQRFGYFPRRMTQPSIWLHAVSVGELLAALPLIRELRQAHPTIPLVVTTTTPTGLARALAALGDDVVCAHVPYDLPDAVARFLDRVRPRVAVIMETELWPNLFHGCAARGVPVLVVNARLSEKSARGYARVAALVRATLRDVRYVAAQSDGDAQRFQTIGATAQQMRVLGNVKYDLHIPPDVAPRAAALRASWGATRPVWIAASTHAGEEQVALDAFARLREAVPDVVLIVVPRHPERFDAVAQLCAARGYRVARRSRGEADLSSCDIYVGDTMGDLLMLYGASDAAFVGGSFVPVGGHNPLEPAALAVPVCVGQHTFNFADVMRRMLDAGAVCVVADAEQLARKTLEWLQSVEARRLVGQRGAQVVEANRGAVQRIAALIAETL